MSLELISFKLCPFVQRSVVTLLYKQVPFEITYIDLASPPEWFLAISPFGKVPALRLDDGSALFESAIINEYIDDITPPQLNPADPLKRARNRSWIQFGEQCIVDQYQLTVAKNEDDFEAVHTRARNNLDKVEAILGEGPWFNGRDFSLVDAAYAPIFMRYALIKPMDDVMSASRYPRLNAWATALLDLPAVRRSVVEDFDRLFAEYVRKSSPYAADRLLTASAA
ncbi:glutathione S-transferase family protein [Acidihalobacter prosperus]|nr:glutathione S-transferase family protein [Acidihalobacter prosperus]